MKCFVVIDIDVPDDQIAEQLDLITNAKWAAEDVLRDSTNPCGYDAPNLKFVYKGEAFHALCML